MDSSLTALSPVDGRYRAATEGLAQLLSEGGLMRERVRVEALWLLQLGESAAGSAGGPLVHGACRRDSTNWRTIRAPTLPGAVKAIEKRINHDVKAVEYFVRDALGRGRRHAGAARAGALRLHFRGHQQPQLRAHAGARAQRRCCCRSSTRCIDALREARARHTPTLPMLSRTHGQTATPTTLGKEFANVARAWARARARFARVDDPRQVERRGRQLQCARGRLPGGRLARRVSRQFVESLRPRVESRTPRRSSRTTGSPSTATRWPRINTMLIDFCRDIWGYISLGYLRQRAVAGEVGSSTMPHKVNPIDFENAEGNLGVANALLRHFSDKLPISRWQRDLTDSTVLRNVGVALGALPHRLARCTARPGQDRAGSRSASPRISTTPGRCSAEAVQTVLRADGVPERLRTAQGRTRAASR